ncbi:MAG: response regulator transcription factor [Elusimicrobiota bacterium]
MARILIAEDDPDIAENICALLNLKGHATTTAADGVLALQQARSEMPDLLLLDVMLPRLSGLDVCRTLRDESKTAKLKILMVTALGRGADLEDAFAAGADDYLIKPFDAERLFKKIEKMLSVS